ncbi:MAG: histidine phosphatase family protein [Clostridia bacterium]|nr:histidine phosphatase family protein [Clostridia bacterium]
MENALTWICLVRHGETDWNLAGRMQGRDNIPMNETGRAQGRACAEAFAEAKSACGACWDKVYASTLDRAVETGTFISRALGLADPEKTEALLERDFGKYSGYSYYDYAVATHAPDVFDWSQLESTEAIRGRIYDFARRLHETAPGTRVIGITHGGVIKTLAKTEERAPTVKYSEGVHNCCINIYSFDGEKLRLEAFNMKGEEYIAFMKENPALFDADK